MKVASRRITETERRIKCLESRLDKALIENGSFEEDGFNSDEQKKKILFIRSLESKLLKEKHSKIRLEHSIIYRVESVFFDLLKNPFPNILLLPLKFIRSIWIQINRSYETFSKKIICKLSAGPLNAGQWVEGVVGESNSPLVSVIVTVYNKEEYLQESLQSILTQSYQNIELVIVDDCSSDDSWKLLLDFEKNYSNVVVYRCFKNRGTYWAKNLGVLRSHGDIITFHDADDISSNDRVEIQVSHLLEKRSVANTALYQRFDEAGRLIFVDGISERKALITLTVWRQVFDEVGWFDCVRYGGDAEFYERLCAYYGKNAINEVNNVLYKAPTSEISLTAVGSGRIQFDNCSQTARLSPSRSGYIKSYRRWHSNNKGLCIPFPHFKRKFKAAKEMLVIEGENEICAVIPTRFSCLDSLSRVVESIMPQVDRVILFVPQGVSIKDRLTHLQLEVFYDNNGSNLKDRVAGLGYSSYLFFLDENLAYPADYIQRMILRLNDYDNKVIVGVQGAVSNLYDVKIAGKYFLYSLNACVEGDKFASFLGVGTLAFHSSMFGEMQGSVNWSDVVDPYFGVVISSPSIPLVLVNRPAGWLVSDGISNDLKLVQAMILILFDSDVKIGFELGSPEKINDKYINKICHIVDGLDIVKMNHLGFDVKYISAILGENRGES